MTITPNTTLEVSTNTELDMNEETPVKASLQNHNIANE
jgi:hypothetical protein